MNINYVLYYLGSFNFIPLLYACLFLKICRIISIVRHPPSSKKAQIPTLLDSYHSTLSLLSGFILHRFSFPPVICSIDSYNHITFSTITQLHYYVLVGVSKFQQQTCFVQIDEDHASYPPSPSLNAAKVSDFIQILRILDIQLFYQ